MSKIGIVLDPGHVEGYNVGYNKSYREGTKMFTLAYYLKEELEKYDKFAVYVTRAKISDDPSLTTRGRLAHETKSTVFISLHSNAFTKTSAKGSVIFRSLRLPNSESLGLKLLDGIVAAMKDGCPETYSRGVQTRAYSANEPNKDYYGVIRNSVAFGWEPEYSYIIEHGFHTNPEECEWLNNDANLRKLAEAEAKVLAEYFGAKLKVIEEPVYNDILPNVNTTIVFNTVDSLPEWAREHIQKAINSGCLKGEDDNYQHLNLTHDLIRMIVILSRAGVFDK